MVMASHSGRKFIQNQWRLVKNFDSKTSYDNLKFILASKM